MTKFHRFKCRSLINCPPSLVISPSSCLCRLPVYPPLEGLRRAFGGTKDPIRNLFIEGFFSRYSLLQNDEETTLVILFGICSWGRFFTRLWRVQNDEEMGPLPFTLFRVRMTAGCATKPAADRARQGTLARDHLVIPRSVPPWRDEGYPSESGKRQNLS